MGIKTKTSSSGRKGKEVSDSAKETTTTSYNSMSKKTRRRQRKQSLVQTLFDTCKDLFAKGGVGFVPSPEDAGRLCSVLDSLKPSDVGLTPEMRYFSAREAERTPTITYLHLHECEKFSMGIFCLPPSGVLPLHNHPGMTVFSKLLMGTMHIKSYDWATDIPSKTLNDSDSQAEASTTLRLAKLKVNSEFTAPCDTCILYPAAGGNIHCFTAVTACAVLDVLSPPYSDLDGRHCAYYHEYPSENFSVEGVTLAENEKEGYSWLQERDRPEDLIVVGAKYMGPKIVKT